MKDDLKHRGFLSCSHHAPLCSYEVAVTCYALQWGQAESPGAAQTSRKRSERERRERAGKIGVGKPDAFGKSSDKMDMGRLLTLDIPEAAEPAAFCGQPHDLLTKAVGVALSSRRRNSVDSPQLSPQRSPQMCPLSPQRSPMHDRSPRSWERRSSSVTPRDLEVPRTTSNDSGQGGSETCGGFLRRPASFSTELNRLDSAEESDSGNDECRWPTLPDWPERDTAAFERGKALIGSMEMDPLSFSCNVLCHLALEIFQTAGLPEELAADVGRVRRFILAVRESMYDNAYHNFYHVFDVTQTVHAFLQTRSPFC